MDRCYKCSCIDILGGLVTTAFALNALSDGHGVIAGFAELLDKVPQKFHMVIEKGTLFAPDGKGGLKDAFSDLPGLGVVSGINVADQSKLLGI